MHNIQICKPWNRFKEKELQEFVNFDFLEKFLHHINLMDKTFLGSFVIFANI